MISPDITISNNRLRWAVDGMKFTAPPATNDNTSWEEVLHLFRCFTRTPGRNRANPERQEKEKSGHQRWANGRNSAEGGGEQTNPQNHPKPTYTEKRT